MEERLQKLLSAAGVCSRRQAEDYITAGRVLVNGQKAVLGQRADPDRDEVTLDGRPLPRRTGASALLMLYKPRGVVTTLSDEKGRRTVRDLLKSYPGGRVWPVGRLDMDSEGLLLLTDDGALTNALLHPRHGIEKEYRVWVSGYRSGAEERLSGPMTLDSQPLQRAKVFLERAGEGEALLTVTIREGKNRQIRRMCAQCGLTVRRLKRVREGSLHLDPTLKPGQWRPLTRQERQALEKTLFLQE